nr:hypothetical protein [Tanacetum cinerariifolium]
MKDSEWREVTRRKRHSVFERLGNSSYRDAFHGNNTIFVYVSKFPSHLTMRELWTICGKKGNIVDVYIAKHKNKLGEMFAFCRLTGIGNKESLIDSLKEVWIGNLRLHVNIARFNMKEGPRSYQADEKRQESVISKPIGRDDSMPKSFLNVLREPIRDKKESNREHVGENSEIILSQEGNCGVVLAVVGCFKDFRSIVNSKIICKNEGFQGVETKCLERLIWLEVEGVPFDAWNNDSFKKICSRWGEVLFVDDTDSTNRFSIRLCLKSSHVSLIFASIVVTFKGVSHVMRVRELCSWTPNFNLDDMDNEGEGSVGTHNDNDEGDSLEDVKEESVGGIFSNENKGEQQNREHIQ